MRKRIKQRLTVKKVNIITSIVTAIMLILLTIFLMIDISKVSVGAVMVYGLTGLSYVFCLSAICWILLYSNIEGWQNLSKK